MFEDILGPSKQKDNQPCIPTGQVPRLVWNGKCNGIDVDGQHIYFNYVDMSNGRTYNVRYWWPDAINKGMFKKDDLVEIVFHDISVPPFGGSVGRQKCRRLDIRSKKWDFIDIQEIIKK